MPDVCQKCGLPKAICVCETIARESEKIEVTSERKRYGKSMTIVRGITKEMDPKRILKELKTRLACGGTIKDGNIELQGEHKKKVKEILKKIGFSEEQIEVT